MELPSKKLRAEATNPRLLASAKIKQLSGHLTAQNYRPKIGSLSRFVYYLLLLTGVDIDRYLRYISGETTKVSRLSVARRTFAAVPSNCFGHSD